MSKITLKRARHLRKDYTDAEYYLWYFLRSRHLNRYKFKRQQPFGPYIVDFVCHRRRLIIELDGEQHAFTADYDEKRSEYLKTLGYKVIRFWNDEVMNDIDNTLDIIWHDLEDC